MIEQNNKLFMVLAIVLFAMLIVTLIISKGNVIIFANTFYSDNLNHVFKTITKLGEVFVIAIIPLFFLKNREDIMYFLLLVALLALVSFGLKNIFAQPRPYRYFWDLRALSQFHFIEDFVNKGNTNSFPSGHTMTAFTIYTYFAINYIKKYTFQVIFIFVAVLVGLSRIYLFQHFFQDVFFGAFCGVFIAVSVSVLKMKKSK